MDGNTLGYFLYYHAYNIPYYLLNAIVLGQQKLEEYKVASELERKQKAVEQTKPEMLNTAKFFALF